jgi:hypothetical protein
MRPVPHPAHTAPPLPQAFVPWLAYGTQVAPLQQPFGQVVALQPPVPASAPPVPPSAGKMQLPEEQTRPPLHATQLAPPFPQVLVPWPAKGTQVAPLQQPFGHVVALQPTVPASGALTHVPFAHVFPAPQDTQALPPEPQAAPDWATGT